MSVLHSQDVFRVFHICLSYVLICFWYFICCHLGVDGLLSRIHPHFPPSSTIQIGSSWCSLSSRRLRSSSWAFNAWKHATGRKIHPGKVGWCWVRFVESSKNASRFRNHHLKSWNMNWQELAWWMSLWSLLKWWRISLAIAKTCENNPPRCHCLPGSQPNLHKASIPLRISLEAETGGPKTANLEIFMFGVSLEVSQSKFYTALDVHIRILFSVVDFKLPC